MLDRLVSDSRQASDGKPLSHYLTQNREARAGYPLRPAAMILPRPNTVMWRGLSFGLTGTRVGRTVGKQNCGLI